MKERERGSRSGDSRGAGAADLTHHVILYTAADATLTLLPCPHGHRLRCKHGMRRHAGGESRCHWRSGCDNHLLLQRGVLGAVCNVAGGYQSWHCKDGGSLQVQGARRHGCRGARCAAVAAGCIGCSVGGRHAHRFACQPPLPPQIRPFPQDEQCHGNYHHKEACHTAAGLAAPTVAATGSSGRRRAVGSHLGPCEACGHHGVASGGGCSAHCHSHC